MNVSFSPGTIRRSLPTLTHGWKEGSRLPAEGCWGKLLNPTVVGDDASISFGRCLAVALQDARAEIWAWRRGASCNENPKQVALAEVLTPVQSKPYTCSGEPYNVFYYGLFHHFLHNINLKFTHSHHSYLFKNVDQTPIYLTNTVEWVRPDVQWEHMGAARSHTVQVNPSTRLRR